MKDKTLKIPAIVSAFEYHDFGHYIDFLKELGISTIKYDELGVANKPFGSMYFAVFYEGKLPSHKTVKRLLEEYGSNIIGDLGYS